MIANNFQQKDKQPILFIILISPRPRPLSDNCEQLVFQYVVIKFLLSIPPANVKFLMQKSSLLRRLTIPSKIP